MQMAYVAQLPTTLISSLDCVLTLTNGFILNLDEETKIQVGRSENDGVVMNHKDNIIFSFSIGISYNS